MKPFSVLLFCIIFLVTGVCIVNDSKADYLNVSAQPYRTVILDAGHGGEDSGAVANDGTQEKDINLLITKNISSFFDFFGIDYIPVRTEDTSVNDSGLDTVRKRKYSDIMNRAKLVNSVENSVLLSIHQNMFSQEKYYGTQVFYTANTEDSAVLAQDIQSCVVNALQPENSREVKVSGSSIYLLHKAKTTSVLVECGFLSNNEELLKLKDKNYQVRMAYFIFRGTLSFLSNERIV